MIHITFSRFIAFIILLTLSPIIILISIIIRLNSRGPIFYKQHRVGQNNKDFEIIKFRTMIVNSENIGQKINVTKNDNRITSFGKFLRQYSLDELPQLINIIKGDMNFIGPRPTILSQVEKYTPRQKQRLLVKPGITGWAQVNGRNSLTWPERIDLDIWYIENKSLRLNLIIILKTFTTIIDKKGIYTK